MATQEIDWGDGSGLKITLSYDGTSGTKNMSVTVGRNPSTSTRTKIITLKTNPSGASTSVTVSLEGQQIIQLRNIQSGSAVSTIPISVSFRGMTITNTNLSVSLLIPVGSPTSSTKANITKLKLSRVNNTFYIDPNYKNLAGTYYITDTGSSLGYYLTVDTGTPQIVSYGWNDGDIIYVTSTNKLYTFDKTNFKLVYSRDASTEDTYYNAADGKYYKFNGTSLVEI